MELELIEAIKNNDVKMVEKYLKIMTDNSLYDPNKKFVIGDVNDQENIKIIIGFAGLANIAIQDNSIACFDFIMEHIGSIHHGNSRIYTEIIKGITETGNLYYLEKAIKTGIIPGIDSFRSRLLMEKAIARNNMKTLSKLLKEIEFDINKSNLNMYGYTPLWLAVDYDNKDAVEMLLNYGADPICINKNGETPLVKAKSDGNTEIFKILDAWRNKMESKLRQKELDAGLDRERIINRAAVSRIKARKIPKIKGISK